MCNKLENLLSISSLVQETGIKEKKKKTIDKFFLYPLTLSDFY